MLKKLVIGLVVLVLAAAAALYVWAQAVLGSELVRGAVARQVSAALGQPVRIGGIRARLIPRVTIALSDVAIGDPVRISVHRLDLGASLRALLSRRIEHGSATLVGAVITLPLTPLAARAGPRASDPPVEIVSIDEIVMRDVAMVSGGRTARAHVELVPDGSAVTIRRLDVSAERTSLSISARLDTLAPATGDLSIGATHVDAAALLAFAGDFTRGAALARDDASPVPDGKTPPTRVDITLNADELTFGTLALQAVQGRGRVAGDAASLDRLTFRVFGGTYTGDMTSTLSGTPTVSLQADLAGLDMGAIMTFAGSPGVMTGRLSGRVAVRSRGHSATDLVRATNGQVRLEITDGTVANLGLVRAIVVGTSMRTGTSLLTAEQGTDTFSRLTTSAAIAEGVARTTDLRFESADVLMHGRGTFALDGSSVAIDAEVQLSEALSKQAGHDLVRYTAKDGRVTLPAAITGRVGDLHVSLDMADVATRALVNRAKEEAGAAIRRGVDRLLGRGTP